MWSAYRRRWWSGWPTGMRRRAAARRTRTSAQMTNAIHDATLALGVRPSFSIPMDDWYASVDEDRAMNARRRVVTSRALPDPAELARARRAARVGAQSGADRRPRHRRQRRVALRGGAGGEAATSGMWLGVVTFDDGRRRLTVAPYVSAGRCMTGGPAPPPGPAARPRAPRPD